MTETSNPTPTRWRPLSEAEFAASPEAKLGGALGTIFGCAAALVAALVLVAAWLIAFGGFFAFTMMSQSIFAGSSITSSIARISLVPQAMLFVWAFVFATMTLARKPSTPKVASVMIAIWAALSIGAQIATRYVNHAETVFNLGSQATLLPYMLLEIALVAAFWGYMSEGRRPNIYFRQRASAREPPDQATIASARVRPCDPASAFRR